MKKKQIWAIVDNMNTLSKYVRFCFLVFPLFLSAASPLKVEVTAKAAILVNAETGAVLWEKNANTPLFPASITKMITALYAVEKKGAFLDEGVTASPDAVLTVPSTVRRSASGGHPPYRLEFGGTHMGIKVDEVLPLRALIYGLMLTSGNDAANVIAEYVSGNVLTFMEELNAFVRAKGCKNTALYTPHGLPWEEHKTTAFDMAILAREFLKNGFLREVVKSSQFIRPQTNKQTESILHQHNALVKPGKQFYYPKAIGIKTGYITAGGYTLVSAAEDGSRKLIAVVLGCEKIEHRYMDAIALFETGFNEKKVYRTLFSKGFDLFSHQVSGGEIPLQAYLSDDVILEYYPSEEPVFKTAVIWQPPALPIEPGQVVGQMQITSQGKVLAGAPIYAVRKVEGTFSYRTGVVWQKFKRGLWNNLTLVMAMVGVLVLAGSFYYSRRSKCGKAR